MVADALDLAVAAHADQAAGTLQLGHLRGKFWKFVFVLAEPRRAALGFLIDDFVRREAVQLYVVMYLAVFIPVIFAERPAVIHDQRRSFGNSRLHEHLQHVLV